MRTIWTMVGGVAIAGLLAVSGLPQLYGQMHKHPHGMANRMVADNSFATKAAQGGMAEVQLGNLAKARAHSQEVKDFGQRMVTDHTKVNDQLKQIAAKTGMTLPTGLDAKDQATYDRLSKLSGVEFDRAYMRDMVSDHRGDVAEFRHESEHGANPDLKGFATATLPVLEEHLKLAESTEAAVKK
jgi:putative membrane protein